MCALSISPSGTVLNNIHYVVAFVSSSNVFTPAISGNVINKKFFQGKIIPVSYPWKINNNVFESVTFVESLSLSLSKKEKGASYLLEHHLY